MRRLVTVIGTLVVLLIAGALPALASDGDLLGSGAVAPDNGGEVAAPVEVVADTGAAVAAAGEDVLASTGLDSGAALVFGMGLIAAGAGVVFASRRRAGS
jgi:LPXTG-motif cell wall-anchored protein